MKSLVYVKGYTSNPDSPIEPQNGRVYLAKDDDDFWTLQLDDSAYFTIHKKLCVRVTEKNLSTINFHKDDEELVTTFMSMEMGIATAVREIGDEEGQRNQILSEALGTIVAIDPMMGDAITEVLLHIAGTYGDKYEEAFPLVDVYNLKYNGGIISSGFNVGSAVKYLKRYLTVGFEKSYNTTDIKKAIQFLLFELVNRQGDEKSKT